MEITDIKVESLHLKDDRKILKIVSTDKILVCFKWKTLNMLRRMNSLSASNTGQDKRKIYKNIKNIYIYHKIHTPTTIFNSCAREAAALLFLLNRNKKL